MNTVDILLNILHAGRGLRVELRRPATDTILAILKEALAQHGLPMNPPSWSVRFEGRELLQEQTLLQAIPDVERRGSITLDVQSSIPSPSSAPIIPKSAAPSSPGAPMTRTAPPSPGFPRELEQPKSAVLEDSDQESSDLEFDLTLTSESQVVALSDEEESRSQDSSSPPSPLASRKARLRTVSRHATVRYYTRMNPQRLYPLMVVITEKAIQEIVQQHVKQASSSPFKVALGSKIEIEPILPGCDCYPPRVELRIRKGEIQAKFCVAPQVLGELMEPRVVIRQDGRLLADIPLEIKVVKQTLTIVMGFVSLVLPFVSSLMKQYRVDFESQAKDGFSFYARIGKYMVQSMSPEIMGVSLLAVTGLLYLWLRPRQRDLFWDLVAVDPREQYKLGQEALAKGDHDKAVDLIFPLLQTHPEFQPAWLFCGSCHYDLDNFAEALRCYQKGLKLGPAGVNHYHRAALAAARLEKNEVAYAILHDAKEKLPAGKFTGILWYNLGCYAVRLNHLEEGVHCLEMAVKGGYKKAKQFQGDPDLKPLHSRMDFQRLVNVLE